MKSQFGRIFVQHPRSVEESYIQHMGFALRFAGQLFGAGLMALVHGIVPCLFEKTASARIAQMHARLQSRD